MGINIKKKIAKKILSEKTYKNLRDKKIKRTAVMRAKNKNRMSKVEKRNAVANFIENFTEIMTQNDICDKYDRIISPRNIEVINNFGSECIKCDLDFPIGLSINNVEKILTAIAQNIYGTGTTGCMAYLEAKEVKKGIKHQLSVVKTWHNAPFAIPNRKMTASELFLGLDIKLGYLIIDMAKAPHLLITGASGSGKSILVQIIISALAYNNTPEELELYFIQASKDDTFKYEILKHCKGCITASSGKNMEERFDKILTMLQYLNDEIDRRGTLVKNNLGRRAEDININIYNKNNPKDKLPVIQIWIDEAATMNKESGDKELNKRVKLIKELTERISATGRFVGVYLINTLQRASKDELSREVKINTSNWVSFKQVDAASSQLAIGDEKSAVGLPQRVFVVRDGRNSTITLGKTPYSTWDKSIEFLESIGMIEENETDEYLFSRYSHWNTFDSNKEIVITQVNQKAIVDEALQRELKALKDESTALSEEIYNLKLEVKSKDLTIKQLKEKPVQNSIISEISASCNNTTIKDLESVKFGVNGAITQKDIASGLSNDVSYKEPPAFDFSSLGVSKVVIPKEEKPKKEKNR